MSSVKPALCLFSKHLNWITSYAELGERIAEIGFDGVDLTVRPGGHVVPEKVEEDLPRAHQAIVKAGLAVCMITTSITDARLPETQRILKTASALRIRFYRRPGEAWGNSNNPLRRIAELQPRLRELVELNREYGMFAGIHNHSGYGVGATPWEVYELVRNFDPRYVGSNFDIGHASIEGAYGGWRSGFWLLASECRIRMVAVKDFIWQKGPKGWGVKFCPLGEGIVDLRTFLTYLREIRFSGPMSLHFEYPAAGDSREHKQKNHLLAMKRDLDAMRLAMQEAGL